VLTNPINPGLSANQKLSGFHGEIGPHKSASGYQFLRLFLTTAHPAPRRWSYERFELEDVRLFKTADFDCSRSGNLRTVFGTRLRLPFAIGSGLRCRGEKHDPVPDLLTGSAFTVTDLQGTSGLPVTRPQGTFTHTTAYNSAEFSLEGHS
jgi:hypothetical protein